MLLNNEWVKNVIREEIKKFLETNENEHITPQNLWGTVKAVLRGKFRAIKVYLKKIETFQINNLTLHLQELEEQQTKPRLSRRKEIKSDFKNLTLYWRPGRYFKDLIKLMSYDLKDERW